MTLYGDDLLSEDPHKRKTPAASQVKTDEPKVFTGQASYYNPKPKRNRSTRPTASGQPFDPHRIAGAMTVDKLAKLPTTVILTYHRPGSGKTIRIPVLINDRGPFATDKYGTPIKPYRPHPTRIIDLTPAAFNALTGGSVAQGILDDVTVQLPAEPPKSSQ
jgi:rare lipoprotein A (RlpA)-like double-psi beta-barrel protein